MIGPDSVVTVPAQAGRHTTILQRAGVVEFDIERQKLPYFVVETPYLSALVKGTQFTVEVGASTATVSVAGGLVEVEDPDRGPLPGQPEGERSTHAAAGTGDDDGLPVNPAAHALALPS